MEESLSISKVYTLLIKVFMVFIISLLFGVVLPGLIAYKTDVFYKRTIYNKLPAEALSKLKKYNNERDRIISEIRRMNDSILNQKVVNNNYLLSITYFQKRIETEQPPIQVMPFYPWCLEQRIRYRVPS
jgi:hypothetical protein